MTAPHDAGRASSALRSLFSALCARDTIGVDGIVAALCASEHARDASEAAERLQQTLQTASEMLAIALPRVVFVLGGAAPPTESSGIAAWATPVEAASELIVGSVWTLERLSIYIDALQAYVDVFRCLAPLVGLGFGPHAFDTPAQASLGRGSSATDAAEMQPLGLHEAASLLCTLLAVREAKSFLARKPFGVALKPCVQLLSRCSESDPTVVTSNVWAQVCTLAKAMLPSDGDAITIAVDAFRRQGVRDALQWQRTASAVQAIECAVAAEAGVARAVLALLHVTYAVGCSLGSRHANLEELLQDARDAATVVVSCIGASRVPTGSATQAASALAVSINALRQDVPRSVRTPFAMFSLLLRLQSQLHSSAETAAPSPAAAEDAGMPRPLAVASGCGAAQAAPCAAALTPSASAMTVTVTLVRQLGSSAKSNVGAVGTS